MGTTPPTHACAVRFMNFCAETKFEKGASDRNSQTGVYVRYATTLSGGHVVERDDTTSAAPKRSCRGRSLS